VVSDNGALSDGLSTGIFVMGKEKGLKLAKKLGLGLIIVDSDGNLYITEDLKGRFKKR
jgi:thiamine biosynthesis lipoprotein